HSYLFIQGPPGAGKTYTGSRVIVALLGRGMRVGVTSNSHKAIHNLLEAVERCARESGVAFQGLKKASTGNPESVFEGTYIRSSESNEEVIASLTLGCQLIAGTAWLFSRQELDGALDHLFVDEAGQVALANLAAMGTSARNIVLLGDQMQLGQPIQGVHPGHSGESSLEYLLDGGSTVAPDRGIFLADTYRMHPAVCGFISSAIYDGRLHSAPGLERQRLMPRRGLPALFREPGLVTVDVASDGAGQRNEAEAAAIKADYDALLGQPFVKQHGDTGTRTHDNILVVAPYNIQVNLLQDILGPKARVGAVDKFQGQE